MEREEGFYFVRKESVWLIAEWDGIYWFLAGFETEFIDSNFDQIGSKVDLPCD